MKIYTKTGDGGKTSLIGGTKVSHIYAACAVAGHHVRDPHRGVQRAPEIGIN